MAFALYFYYMVGQALEYMWGAFRFNLYFFSGVLLHVIKAPRPVDLPGDGANLHRTVGGVENDVVFLVDIQHSGRTQNAMICRLSAALRIKGGAV